jgi:hypothetical protein
MPKVWVYNMFKKNIRPFKKKNDNAKNQYDWDPFISLNNGFI